MPTDTRAFLISVGLACLVFLFVWSPGAGLECTFFDLDPTASRETLAGALPGLFREAYGRADFTGPPIRDVSSLVDLTWETGKLRDTSIRWSGWLHVPVDGPVRLGLCADDAALLIVDDVARVHNWGFHWGSLGAVKRWANVPMTRGFHRLRLDFKQGDGPAKIQLLWQLPGRPEELVPSGALWRVPVRPTPGTSLALSSPIPERAMPVPAGTPILTTDLHSDLEFRRGLALFIPYVSHHDGARRGHPATLAPLCARWKSRLVPPVAGRTTIRLEGSGDLDLSIGGSGIRKPAWRTDQSVEVELPTEGVDLTLEAYDPGVFRRIGLDWTLPGGVSCPVPPGAFQHPAAPSRFATRAIFVLLVLTALVLLTRTVGGPTAWGAWMWERRHGHAFVTCLIVALCVRLTDLTLVPGLGETWDEANSHFVGTHLVGGQVPVGWDARSMFPVVQGVMVHGVAFRIVAPMVHYPPVFHALVGLVNRAAGARTPFEMHLAATRGFTVVIAVLTLALLWPAARGLGLRPLVAVLACAFLAVYPTAVLQSRLVKEENLVSLLYMAVLVLVSDVRRAGLPWGRWMAALCIILAILTKQMGVAAGVLAISFSLLHGRFLRAGWYGLVTVLGVGLFTWYGMSWSGQCFLDVQRWNSMYSQRVDAMWPLLAENTIVQVRVASAWVVGLWLAAALTGSGRNGRPLLLALASYVAPLTLAYPSDHNYGWYRIPLLPLWGLAWGEATRRLARQLNPLVVLLWVGCFILPTAQLLNLPWKLRQWCPTLTDSESLNVVLKGLVVVLVGPAFAASALPSRLRRPASIGWTGLVVGVILICFASASVDWSRMAPPGWPGDPVNLGSVP